MLEGTGNESAVSVSEFPVAWKVVVVDDARYSGFEYVRWDPVSHLTTRVANQALQAFFGGRPIRCGIWHNGDPDATEPR